MEENIQANTPEVDIQSVQPAQVEAPIQDSTPEAPMSIKDAVRDAFKRSRDPNTGKFVAGADKEQSATPTPEPHSQEPQVKPDTALEQKGPPKRLSPEIRQVWDTLPPNIQAEFRKIDADTSSGFEKFKKPYQALDAVKQRLDPYLNRANIQFHDFVEQANNWMWALSGPQRVQAAKQFLTQFGIDPSLVAGISPQSQQQNSQVNTRDPYVLQLAAELDQFKQSHSMQLRGQAQTLVDTWSKDKPHFNAVRQDMHDLLATGKFMTPNGQPDLDAAYERAVWSNPDTRAMLLKDQQDQAKTAQKQAIQQSRRAAQSLPVGSPGIPVKPNGRATRTPTARESIMAAMRGEVLT